MNTGLVIVVIVFGILLLIMILGFIFSKRISKKNKPQVNTEIEPGNVDQESRHPVPANHSKNVSFQQNLESVGRDNVGISLQVRSDYTDDAPSYEEALQMEKISQNEIRRRVSSGKSLKSDDLPDYDFIDCPVYSDEEC